MRRGPRNNFRRKFCGVDWRSALSAPVFRPLTYGKYAASPEYGGFRASHLNIALRRGHWGPRVKSVRILRGVNFRGPRRKYFRWGRLANNCVKALSAQGSPRKIRKDFARGKIRGPRGKSVRVLRGVKMRSRTTKYAPFCGKGFSLFFIRILPSGEGASGSPPKVFSVGQIGE